MPLSLFTRRRGNGLGKLEPSHNVRAAIVPHDGSPAVLQDIGPCVSSLRFLQPARFLQVTITMGSSCFTSPNNPTPVCTYFEDNTIISTPQPTTQITLPSSEDKPTFAPATTLAPISIPNPVPVPSQILGSSATVILSTNGTTTAGVLSQTSGATVSSTSNGSKGVSAGAVAGIAIAMLLTGAAAAFLATFFLFKRRKRTHGSTSDPVPESGTGPNGPGMMQVGSSSRAAKGDIDLTNLSHSSDFLASVLPQTADDHEVKKRVSTLYDLVHLHVENYYRDAHATFSASMEKDLGEFLTPESAKLLRGSVRPTVAIKHILMGYVLGITAPEAETGNKSEGALFPRDVAGVGSGNYETITESLGL